MNLEQRFGRKKIIGAAALAGLTLAAYGSTAVGEYHTRQQELEEKSLNFKRILSSSINPNFAAGKTLAGSDTNLLETLQINDHASFLALIRDKLRVIEIGTESRAVNFLSLPVFSTAHEKTLPALPTISMTYPTQLHENELPWFDVAYLSGAGPKIAHVPTIDNVNSAVHRIFQAPPNLVWDSPDKMLGHGTLIKSQISSNDQKISVRFLYMEAPESLTMRSVTIK